MCELEPAWYRNPLSGENYDASIVAGRLIPEPRLNILVRQITMYGNLGRSVQARKSRIARRRDTSET